MKTITKDELLFFVREGTLDEFVVNENCYRKISTSSEDIWLDAGGNIGAFACKYANKVCKIISYEPEVENFRILKQNLSANNITNVEIYNKALVSSNAQRISFYLNVKKNKGSHTLIQKRGRDKIIVQCDNIANAISTHNISCIKMDIEGAEYDIIKKLNLVVLSSIKEMIIEYHFSVLKDKDKKMFDETIMKLKSAFINVDYKRNIGGDWTTIIYCSNR